MKGQKRKSGISKSSVAESVILILFQFLLNINLRISWYRRHRQPSGTAHITRMKVISFGASLTGMTTRTLCLSKAKQTAIKEGYQIAFSNPSFEVWFLLHFNNQTTPVENCEAAIKLLKKKGRLEQYEKNKEVYEQLKPLQEAAIERAKKRVAALQTEHTEILSRESNPVTTVAELVEYLNSKQ